LTAFFYSYLAMLLGIITIAAAEHSALAHPFDALSWSRASLLSGGVAVFLAGCVLFRQQLGIGPVSSRLLAALFALAAIPIGAGVSATAQIGTLVALLGVAIVIDHRSADR
jgi:low temperature requirement protein LtrA